MGNNFKPIKFHLRGIIWNAEVENSELVLFIKKEEKSNICLHLRQQIMNTHVCCLPGMCEAEKCEYCGK